MTDRMSNLASLGFDFSFWKDSTSDAGRLDGHDFQIARVVQEQRGTYLVAFSISSPWVPAEVLGGFRHKAKGRADYPAVGDFVRVEKKEDRWLIREVLNRKTKLSRKEAGMREEEQILAANVDVAFIMSSVNMEFNLNRLDRFVALCLDAGIAPVLLLSKIDLDEEYQEIIDELATFHRELKIIPVSTLTGIGLDQVRAIANDRTSVLIGRSGVGKSTLVNALIQNQIQHTQEIRESDSKGRHTTTYRSLFAVPSGGLIIDTPGVRELQLWDLDGDAEEVFDEIVEVSSQCRFADCTHRNEPGCRVREMVEQGMIEPHRYESYLKIHEEKANQSRRQDRTKVLEKKQKAKVLTKALNKMYKKY